MICATKDANLIIGFRPARTAPMITQLQFADDNLLFGVAKENKVKNMIVVVRCFEAVSELKVNVFKSSLIGVSVDPQITHLLADLMFSGCDGLQSGDYPDDLPRCPMVRVPKSM